MNFLQAINERVLEKGKIIAPTDEMSKIVNLYFKNVDNKPYIFMYDNVEIGPVSVEHQLGDMECEILDYEPEWTDENRAACSLLNTRDRKADFEIGNAIGLLKAGIPITRRAWEKGTFIYYVSSDSYPAKMSIVKGLFENDMVPYAEYISYRGEDGIVRPWNPTNEDVLATDYYAFDVEGK